MSNCGASKRDFLHAVQWPARHGAESCMVSSLQSSESCCTCKPAKFQKASKYSLSPRQCYGPPISHNLRLVYLMFCWMVKEGKTHVKLKGSCFQNQNMEQPSSWKSCPPVAVRWRWWMPAMTLGQWLLSILNRHICSRNNSGLVFYKILFSINILWSIIFWRSIWDMSTPCLVAKNLGMNGTRLKEWVLKSFLGLEFGICH